MSERLNRNTLDLFFKKSEETKKNENIKNGNENEKNTFNIKVDYCNFKKKKITDKQQMQLIQFYDVPKFREGRIKKGYKIIGSLNNKQGEIIKPKEHFCSNKPVYSYKKLPFVLDYDIESDDWYKSSEDTEDEESYVRNSSLIQSSQTEDGDYCDKEIVDDSLSSEDASNYTRTTARPCFSTETINFAEIQDHKYFKHCNLIKSSLGKLLKKSITKFIKDTKKKYTAKEISEMFNVNESEIKQHFNIN